MYLSNSFNYLVCFKIYLYIYEISEIYKTNMKDIHIYINAVIHINAYKHAHAHKNNEIKITNCT